MKATAFCLLIVCVQATATGHAQSVTLSEKGARLEKVLNEIKRQTKFEIVYRWEQLQNAKPVDIDVTNMPLKDALDICFKDQPFSYNIVDKMIVLGEKKAYNSVSTPPANIDIKGRVTDSDGKPLAGANVKVKGTSIGTTTNENGEYLLTGVDENATLEISFVGYEMQEIRVNKRKEMDVKLKLSIGEMNAVSVNTGFQVLKPNEVAGSVVVITKEQLDQRVSGTILEKLEGITNGLVFNKDPQSGANKLRIRGESTIYGYDNPLVVVDNFPYKFEKINEINPNDVESITILKDAAAASIWGVQAGNGVIVITTKKGRINQPLRIGLNFNTTVSEKPSLFYSPLMSPSDYIDLETFLFNKGKYTADLDPSNYLAVSPVVEILNNRKLGKITSADSASQINALRGIDWRDEFLKYVYRNASTQQYQINLSGGSEKTSYYFSAGYDYSSPSLIGDNGSRITFNNNTSYRPIRNLEFQIGLSYVESKSENNSLGGNIPNLYPYMALKDASGKDLAIPQRRAEFEDTIGNHGFLNWKYYPLQERDDRDNVTKSYTSRIVTSLRYSILKSLSFEASYQYYRAIDKSRRLTKKESYIIRDKMNRFAILNNGNYIGSNYPAGGTLDLSTSDLVGQNGRLKFNFSQKWGSHSVIAVAGFDVKEEKSESNSSTLLGYDDATGSFATPNTFISYPVYYPAGTSTLGDGSAFGLSYAGVISRFKSYYGILDYSFRNQYSIQGSIRFDGSNYFGVKTNNKTVPLWSVGGKWEISKEKFYHFKLLPELALRVTYGYNGNLSPSIVAVTTLYYSGNANYTGLPYAYVNNVPNPQLRWEKSGQLNIGLDMAAKNATLSGTIEYFRKDGKDLIGDSPIDPTTGITQLRGNFSDMKSHGVDIQISSKNLSTADLKWNTTFVINYAKEIVTRYNNPIIPSSYLTAYKGSIVPIVGYPLRSIFSYKWAGLDPTTGGPRIILGDTINKSYSAATLANIKPGDLVYSGRYDPPFTGFLTNNLTWRNFTFSFSLSYKFGHYFRRSSISYYPLFNINQGWNSAHKDFDNRWQKPGDEKFTNVPSLIYPDNSSGQRDAFYNNSDILIEKADHIRLQFINLSYSLDKHLVKKISFQNLNLFFYANNLGIIWRANNNHIDPDYPYLGYPPPRTYSFGIKAEF